MPPQTDKTQMQQAASVRKARLNAADTLADVLAAGGDAKRLPAAECLASLGAAGRHLQNVERDYHRWQAKMRSADGMQLRPFAIDLPLKHPKVAGVTCIEPVPVPVIACSWKPLVVMLM